MNKNAYLHKLQQRSKRSSGEGDPLIEQDMQRNIDYIHHKLHSPADLTTKELELGIPKLRCILMNIDGMTDKDLVHRELLKPMIDYARKAEPEAFSSSEHFLKLLKDEAIPLNQMTIIAHLDDAIHAMLCGDTCVFLDNSTRALIVGSKGWKIRSIEEPQTESIIRGPKDGFIEDIRINSSLVRRRVKDVSLRMDSYWIGRRSNQEVIITYVEDIANPELVEEVKRRLLTIDVDDVEGSGFIEQWISDSYLSPFPQIINTERPDRFTSSLMQGRVGILVDGTPFQLLMPISISSAYSSPEDYYQPWQVASLIRLLRFCAGFVATFLPGFYIALAEYHHGMIPSNIAFSIAASREGVPFPVFIEAGLMEVTLEILREAGVRLPKQI